jgi:putative flavoprotein involved in K+ transport
MIYSSCYPRKADDFPSCSGDAVCEKVDTIVVGAGPAGLAMSYHLKRLGREHVVIERGRVAESWRSERWDSLMFQFPNSSIQLPGYTYEADEPNGYVPKDEIVRFIESYATLIGAPLRCGLVVNALRQNSTSGRLLVETKQGSSFEAVNVVVATGPFQLPQIPAFANSMPIELFQVHSRDYRNPSQLPPGAVLVVGSGASGCQIAEELHQAGRKVYLSTGRFHKTPRRYRGHDIYWWFEVLGIWHQPLELQPEVRNLRFVVTGAGGGHDIDLRRFAADGMTLLGRLRGFSDGKLQISADLENILAQGDAWFASLRKRMDDYAQQNGMAPSKDMDEPAPALPPWSQPITELDPRSAGITSVVWCSGFRYDFGWVKLPILNEAGEPLHMRGVTQYPGLYFLGLRRTYAVSSALLAGVGNDAAFIAEHIAAR